MENQHRKISGYRELTQAEIDLMNEIKAKGEELRALVAKIEKVAIPTFEIESVSAEPTGEVVGLEVSVATEADDPRFWLRFADSSFRSGIMYAVRAVAKPTTY